MISSTPPPEPSEATEALLRLLLTRAPLNLAIFDREMNYLLYTSHWVDHLPVGDQPLNGRSHATVLGGLLACWEDGHQRALLGESVSSEATSYLHPDGSKRWISWRIAPWTDGADRIAGSLITFQEITYQLQIESTLRREREAATSTNLAKVRLLVSTSYEVRAAMNSIIGMAHLCLRSAPSEKDRHHLGTIIKEAKVLTSSFNDILDLSKVETGNLQLERCEFKIGEVLNELAIAIGIKAEEKGVEFVYQLPATPPPTLEGDPVRLKQVLTRLCENALNLTDHGEVELGIEILEWEASSVTLEFSVRDTSPALTPQECETLMAPFTPGECAGTSVLAKTRLGLSICKSLIGLMNGQMRVASEPGQGNVFLFTAEFAVSPQDRVQIDTPPNALIGARVLVVDDHKLARKTMARLLKCLEFDVAVAESGERAIEMAEEGCERGRPYQFVFMDYLMPGMNGLQATARLKDKLRPHGPPKVILMTGRPMDDKMQEMADSPLDGYISKPFTPSLIFYAMLDAATAWPVPAAAGAKDSRSAKRPASLRGRRVLLVEDDPINQEIVREILGDAGVTVESANNGKEGLECLKDKSYDAVLMDIQMPVMDGYEATCRIRNEERFTDLPIIALTASAMTLDRHASLEVGMNAHVAKPINPDELFSVLSEWIEPGADREAHCAGRPLVNGEERPGSSLPQFECLDAERGLALMGGNEKLFRRILQKFAANQAATDREIRAALDRQDDQTALRLTHTLKGLAGNIGALKLGKSVETFEAVLKGGDSDHYGPLLDLASSELQRVVREIANCGLEAEKGAPSGDGATALLRS